MLLDVLLSLAERRRPRERAIVRAALTQTVNAYRDMPATVEDCSSLSGTLDDVRTRERRSSPRAARRRRREQGAQVIGFGELFPGPYFALRSDPMWTALAEDARDGATVTTLRGRARSGSA